MEVEITRIGERGQAVIPKSIREGMPAAKGDLFGVVLIDKDTLVMKRIDKRDLTAEFVKLRASIKKRLSDEEIVEELKKARKVKSHS